MRNAGVKARLRLDEASKGADRSVPRRRRSKVGTSLKHSIYAIGIPLAEAQLPVVQVANRRSTRNAVWVPCPDATGLSPFVKSTCRTIPERQKRHVHSTSNFRRSSTSGSACRAQVCNQAAGMQCRVRVRKVGSLSL